jgi:hypothetical protein
MPTAAILLPIQGLSLIYWWVAGSYLGVDIYSSRSFISADGWCDPPSQGLGSHCWGDYYYPIFLVFSQPNPWLEYGNAYPAASLIPFMITHILGSITGITHAGLVLFLGTMVLLIGWSVWAGTKGLELEPRLILVTTLTFFSPPLISALDRGNSVGFIVPLLVWLYWSLRNKSENQGMLAIVLLTLIKPHFAVLLFVFLLRGQITALIKAILLGGTIHVLSFLIVAGDRFPMNIYDWLARLVSYQDYTSVQTGWPPNISFAQGLYSLISLFPGLDVSTPILAFLNDYQGLIGPMVLLSVISIMTVFRQSLKDVQVAIILTSLVAMTSSTSYYYYAIFSIPALLALIQMKFEPRPSGLNGQKDETATSQSTSFILWCALMLTMVQLPLYQLLSDKIIIVTTANLVGLFWIGAYIMIFAVLLKGRTKNKINKTIRN